MDLKPITQVVKFQFELTNTEAAALYWEMQEAIKYTSPESYPMLHLVHECLTTAKVGRLRDLAGV